MNMLSPAPFLNRLATLCGLLCLGACLSLLPGGVRAVHAEDGAEVLMSVDPVLVSKQDERSPSIVPVMPPATHPAPTIPLGEEEKAQQPGGTGREVQPGVLVLNMRGYNYGPPPAALDPAALDREAETR